MNIFSHLNLSRLFAFLSAFITTFAFSHTGSSGDPFTKLGQAKSILAAGIYYFNLNGVNFNTYVDINGYVQIAIDFGNGTGDLPQAINLTRASRGILQPSVLASLTSTSHVRISSSTGNFDVISSNATIISRVQSNLSLHRGVVDNAINDYWSGIHSGYITINASGCTNSIANLHQNVVHVCGNGGGFHWVPTSSNQREVWNNGDIPDAASFTLWVRDANYVLPVELVNLNSFLIGNNQVEISWETVSEINSDYFSIERSQNAIQWKEIAKIYSAINSLQQKKYAFEDHSLLPGLSYYRIKQVDLDGQYKYSKTIKVLQEEVHNTSIFLFPNPTDGYIRLKGSKTELAVVKIYNTMGEDVINLIRVSVENESSIGLDFSGLPPGAYWIRTATCSSRVYKQ